MGQDVEWEAVTTRLEPGKRIAWRSTDDSAVKTSGQVTFNELPSKQTEITVTLQYVPPGGVAGDAAARLLADPREMLQEDLQRFKSYVESRVPA